MNHQLKLDGLLDRQFLRNPKPFILQSLAAFIISAIILYFVEILTHAAIVAALGSSTFIVFAIPHSRTAEPRKLIGGHIVGIAAGAFCYFVLLTGFLEGAVERWEYVTWLVGALAIGLSIFFMTITNTEHPPAAGTALGIVAHVWSNQAIIFMIVCVVCLAVVRKILGHRLVDLY
ncbi:MAG TPA: HPP family protein [Dehalococcoidia bacterium]|nr:HPP family protein [Dehalococcoidia bacterium]